MLPSLCVLSDNKQSTNLENTLKQCIDLGAPWISLREYDMPDFKISNIATNLVKYSENYGTIISVWNNPKISEELQIGLHLNMGTFSADYKDRLNYDCPLGASTHTPKEISSARGSDYITISPVYDSISKVGYTGIGINTFKSLCGYATQPVYAMGGITESNIIDVLESGAYGIVMCGEIMNDPKKISYILKLL